MNNSLLRMKISIVIVSTLLGHLMQFSVSQENVRHKLVPPEASIHITHWKLNNQSITCLDRELITTDFHIKPSGQFIITYPLAAT